MHIPQKPVEWLVLLALNELSILFNVTKCQCQEHLICVLYPSNILKSIPYPPCDVPYSNGAFILSVFYMGLSASTLYWSPCLLAANPISKYHYIFQLQTNKRTRGDSLTFLGSHGCGSMVTCQLPPMSSSTAPRSSAQSVSSGKLAVSSLTLPELYISYTFKTSFTDSPAHGLTPHLTPVSLISSIYFKYPSGLAGAILMAAQPIASGSILNKCICYLKQ